jgi:DNA-binding response OmpR family regulator
MNSSNGGPHILLFERDQQMTALLMSEFQLAGYECHAARTAVEVFDAIARFPVRLVLVNLAQAAATRREFWVALDTQRRGKGVQVLTVHCTNLAGYGQEIPKNVPKQCWQT